MQDRDDMPLDWVDGADNVIGVVRRSDVFAKKANFRVAHVLLLDEHGRVLLQRISSKRARHPGYWGATVAGYVAKGETYEQAAERRLRDELSLSLPSLRYVGKTSMLDGACTKFIGVFDARLAGGTHALKFNPEDFGGHEFVELERLTLPARRKLRRPFTPTFLHVLNFYLGGTGGKQYATAS